MSIPTVVKASGTPADARRLPAAGTMISLADIEKAAASVLGPAIWDFVTGGSGDEQPLRANRAALDAVAVVPRLLSGVGGASAATVLVASPSEFPAAAAYPPVTPDELRAGRPT